MAFSSRSFDRIFDFQLKNFRKKIFPTVETFEKFLHENLQCKGWGSNPPGRLVSEISNFLTFTFCANRNRSLLSEVKIFTSEIMTMKTSSHCHAGRRPHQPDFSFIALNICFYRQPHYRVHILNQFSFPRRSTKGIQHEGKLFYSNSDTLAAVVS